MTDSLRHRLDGPKSLIPICDILKEDLSVRIHKWLTYEQIEEIRGIFISNNLTLAYPNFRDLLEQFNIILTDNQYLKLFLKLNLDFYDDFISWDEFISYLIFCYQEDDPYSQKEALILPIPEEPIVKNGNHKTPIIDMTILQSVVQQDNDEKQFGYYLTASKDGAVNFWSPDLEVTRKGQSKSQYLKYAPTWILCIAALSDVRIVCVSSTERELRFYDVTATNFHLRVVIKSVPYAIGTMTYCFSKLDDSNSKLMLGDFGGNLRILEFSSKLRGPFKSSANSNLIEFSWNQILKGKFPEMHATEYLNVFPTNISQVFYSYKFDTYYIAAATYSRSQDKSGLIAIDVRGVKSLFHIPQGVTTFCLDEINSILATGGPDSFLRFWEPHVSSKASSILEGHRSGIVYIFIQPNDKKCYSIDIMKTIKVWHLIDLTTLQTFSDLRILLAHETQFVCLYNRAAHELLIAGRKLIIIKCCPKIQLHLTDGNTHAGAVSVVLYNKLFENTVTCGLDSYIIVWDTWTGKRLIIMKKCHTQDSMGQMLDIEITAAAFDPSQHYLITGARDGSLKIWQYNNAVCTRNLKIDDRCEVTAIFWIPDRILVVGWNRRLIEFADVKGMEYADGKNWLRLHDTDITSAACKRGEVVVTGSYTGELVFWKSETGQPYRKHKVKVPQKHFDLYFTSNTEINDKDKDNDNDNRNNNNKNINNTNTNNNYNASKSRRERSISTIRRVSVKKAVYTRQRGLTDTILTNEDVVVREISERNMKNSLRRKDSRGVFMPMFESQDTESSPEKLLIQLNLSIHAILILTTRPVTKDHGNVIVALDNGWIQVYSQHEQGGYIAEFYVAHKFGDCCISMTTDLNNQYLFTGTALGYIKIWLLQNFCIPESEHTRICKPTLRLQFFFLSNDRINGRAKRIAKSQNPFLLSSHKAHIRAITSIVYLNIPQIIITGSHDQTVRMWTLGGRYLGTLGGSVLTKQLIRNELINEREQEFRVPPDIFNCGSTTTMKVLTGIIKDPLADQIQLRKDIQQHHDIELNDADKLNNISMASITQNDKKSRICGHTNRIKDPILGKYIKTKEHNKATEFPILDKSLPYIPVYSHLNLQETRIVENTTTSDEALLRKLKKLNFMNHYKRK